MKDRLKAIVRYKTNGKQKEFAELIGWSPAYLSNLLKGNSIGLQPVIAILKAFPEIDARWLLLGEGNMMMVEQAEQIKQQALEHVRTVLDLEKFLPVMSPEELEEYEQLITTHATPNFGNEAKVRWLSKITEQQMGIEHKVSKAMKQSDELCRQRTAKE